MPYAILRFQKKKSGGGLEKWVRSNWTKEWKSRLQAVAKLADFKISLSECGVCILIGIKSW